MAAADAQPMAVIDAQPMDVLREKVARGLAVLNDPQYDSPERRIIQEQRIWHLSQSLFDFTAMSRLVLSSHWKTFSPEQRTAFIREFAAFLRRAYVPLLLEKYNGEQIAYERQILLSSSRAQVEVLVLWQDKKIPLTVRMIHRDGDWRVYDVSALGISALKNYRAQFQVLLQEETPEEVIERLRNQPGRSL